MCLFGAWRRKAPTASSAKLASHTRVLPQLPLMPIACFLPWCSFFPSHKRLRFHLIMRTTIRLSKEGGIVFKELRLSPIRRDLARFYSHLKKTVAKKINNCFFSVLFGKSFDKNSLAHFCILFIALSSIYPR